MSMLTLNGTVANIYESPHGVNKTTGESFGGQHRIQIMCQNTLQNGERRIELVDLTIEDVALYPSGYGEACTGSCRRLREFWQACVLCSQGTTDT